MASDCSWLFLLLAPVLYVLQEMVARLGAVTGAGHARLIFERFGRRWGAFALGDLIALNLLTLVTEFVGIDFALRYFGVSRYVSVPVAAGALLTFTATGKFRRWEQAMYALVAMNLVAVPLALLSHPHPAAIVQGAVPGLRGEFTPSGVLFMMAIVGAALSPWQLFFQQSNVVDKRITARWLNYERADTMVGALLFTIIGGAIVIACAFAFSGSALHGGFVDLGSVAHGLAARLGGSAGTLFALVLLNGSVLCAAVVTLTTSYALGDVLGLRHSLHRRWRQAPMFYGSFAPPRCSSPPLVELAPGVPLGTVTTLVQALDGVLLPSATVFLLLLCNDRAVLGPWVNPRWLNALATLIIGVLLVLSGLLTTTTLLPHVDVRVVALALGAMLAVGLSVTGVLTARRRTTASRFGGTPRERATWTMPPLEMIAAPAVSEARATGWPGRLAPVPLARCRAADRQGGAHDRNRIVRPVMYAELRTRRLQSVRVTLRCSTASQSFRAARRMTYAKARHPIARAMRASPIRRACSTEASVATPSARSNEGGE